MNKSPRILNSVSYIPLPVSVEQRGYVALLKHPLTRHDLDKILLDWLMRFDAIEQLTLAGTKTLATVPIRNPDEVFWERDLQFRVLAGEQFAWVYLTAERRVMESEGLAEPNGPILSLDVFAGIPFCERIVSDRDDKTLDEWEAKGWM